MSRPSYGVISMKESQTLIDYSKFFDKMHKTAEETNSRLSVIEEKVKVICTHSVDISNIKEYINQRIGAKEEKSSLMKSLTLVTAVLMTGAALATLFIYTTTA